MGKSFVSCEEKRRVSTTLPMLRRRRPYCRVGGRGLLGWYCVRNKVRGVPRKVETNAASPSHRRPRRRETKRGKGLLHARTGQDKERRKSFKFSGGGAATGLPGGREGEKKTFVCVREEAKLKHGEGGQRGYRVGRQQEKLVMERGEERRTAGPSSYKLHTKV